jgi:hypothetical protein
MTCGFCTQEGRTPGNACATCQYPNCARFVCTSQCAGQLRPHADWCKCACGLLICDRDRSSHMVTRHGGQVIGGCFPLTTGVASAQGVETSAQALSVRTGAGSNGETATTLTHFLNVIAPGHAALVAAVARLDPTAYTVDPAYWPNGPSDADPVLPGVRFAPTFFTEATLQRVLILASHQLGHAATSNEFRDAKFAILTPARRQTLDMFSAVALRSRRSPTDAELQAWSPTTRRGFLDELRFLLTLDPPDGADAVAQWLTEAHSLSGTPALMT